MRKEEKKKTNVNSITFAIIPIIFSITFNKIYYSALFLHISYLN